MATAPIDQGAILASGRNVVPDVAAQLVQQALLNIQGQNADTASLSAQTTASRQGREQQRQQEYQAALSQLGENPTSAALTQLMLRFPEVGEDINRARVGMDESQQRTDRQQLANVANAAMAGNYSRAAQDWRRRLEADRAAGQQDDPVELAVLADLESADPRRQREGAEALATMFARTGNNFAQDLQALGVTVDRVENGLALNSRGEGIAQDPRSRMIPGSNGSFYEYTPQLLPGIPVLGAQPGIPGNLPPPVSGVEALPREDGGAFADVNPPAPPAAPIRAPSASRGANAHPVTNGGAIISQLFPNATVTSTRRDPNSRLGRANPNSWHNTTGAAVDVAPISGMTYNQYLARIRSAGYQIIEARDEQRNPLPHTTGPNWHVVIGSNRAGQNAIARVRTRQEYDRLPSGSPYVAPDGRVRTKA